MKLTITHPVAQMLKHAVHTEPNLEIGGFAKVQIEPGPQIILTDLIIPPQTVGGAAVHFDEETFEWLMVELAKKGETISDWPCWWHSHARMDTFCSPRDKDTLSNLVDIMRDKWAVALVTNTKQDYYCELETVTKIGNVAIEVPVSVQEAPLAPELAGPLNEMLTQVKKANYSSTKTLAGHVNQALPIKPGERHSIIVWCDTHGNWNDMCPVRHTVAGSETCPHTPNCGAQGCFGSSQRKMMKKNRKAAITALEDMEQSGLPAAPNLFGEGEWDNYDEDFSILEDPLYA